MYTYIAMYTIHVIFFKELGSQSLPVPDRNRTLMLAPFLPETTQLQWPENSIWCTCFSPPNTVSTLVFLFRLSYDTKLCRDAGVSVVFHSV